MGGFCRSGTPTELYESPVDVFTARFIGSPSMNLVPGKAAGSTLTASGATIAGLDASAITSGDVLIGVRPHDLIVGAAGAAGLSLSGLVTAVEPLGSETLVHLDIAGTEVIATAPGKMVPKVDTTVTASALPGSLYLFSAATEQSLGRL